MPHTIMAYIEVVQSRGPYSEIEIKANNKEKYENSAYQAVLLIALIPVLDPGF